jgi:sporulation protein YlmC with PRC-barrel domain
MSTTRILVSGLLVAGLLGMLGAGVLAEEQSTQQNESTAPAAAQPGRTPSQMPEAGQALMLEKTSELIGKQVKNPQGENLGVIYDLVLTPDYHHVSYVALSYGGAFSVGSKLYAIPWQALQVGPRGQITMSATREHFTAAPAFPRNNWPSQGDPRWLRPSTAGQPTAGQSATGQSTTSESAAGRSATGQGAAGNMAVQVRRVTHLTGTEVKNPEGQDIADIEDFVVNTKDGRIVYDIVSFGGVAGVGEKYAAVPPAAVQIQPQTHTAILNTTEQTLQSVAFQPSQFPDLASREYMQRIYSTFRPAAAGAALGYVPAEPQPGAAERAWGPESQFVKSFNPSNVKTIKGTVQSVGVFQPENAPLPVMLRGLRLRVQTSEGNLVTVYAGPIWYAEQQNFFVMPGDEITVTACEAKIRSRAVMVASQITRGTQTLRLLDQSGKPQWKMERPGAPGAAAGQPEQQPSGQRSQTRP